MRCSEHLIIPRVEGFPTELVAQVLGEGLLHEAIFGVKVGEGHCSGAGGSLVFELGPAEPVAGEGGG